MKLAWVGAGLCALGVMAVLFGILPLDDAAEIGERVWPILLFVVSISIVAELATKAGLFDHAAFFLARLSRGYTVLLWIAVVMFAVVTTVFLSLDTTAVLLTPVAIAVARRHGMDPTPFAFVTVVLANTASLVLPVSNLTNLLAVERWGSHDPLRFLGLLGPSALAAIVVSAVVLTVWFLPRLPRRYVPAARPRNADRLLLIASAGVVVVLLPLLVSGLPPWMPASGAALVLLGLFAVRARRALHPGLVPVPLLLFASGLFLVVGAAGVLGADALAAWAAGQGENPLDLARLAGTGALTANAMNNLPAYLALESSAATPERSAALLIGVNAGPLVTPWASLATLLWHQRLVADGVHVGWGRFMLVGLVVAPLAVGAAVWALAI